MRKRSGYRKILLGKNGFTLLELLMAITLCGLIGLSVYRTFASGISAYYWLVGNRLDIESSIFRERIADDLRNISLLEDGYFEGRSHTVSFLVREDPAYASMSEGHIKKIEYVLTAGSLVRNTYYFGSRERISSVTVLRGLERARFSYLPWEEYRNGSMAFSSEHSAIPSAVRVHLTLANTGRELESTLMVPLRSLL